MLLVSVLLVVGMAQAMLSEQCSEQAREQEEKMGDADSVREWLLEGVEVIEMERMAQSHIEALFKKRWHRNMLKQYSPDMVSDALTQLEQDADFQMLAHGHAALAHAEAGSQPERGLGSQALESSSGAARAKTERVCMAKLLSALAHAEKRVADDKYEQRWEKWHETQRYIIWIMCTLTPALLIGGLWPVVRCGP